MRPGFVSSLLLVFAFVVVNAVSIAEEFPARVVDVVAGDIYKVENGKGKKQLVVLFGVSSSPSPLTSRQAREFATQKALNQQVTVRLVERREGMTLVELTLVDGSNLGQVMLRNGLLRWDSLTAPEDQGLKDLETLAKHDRLGMWASLAGTAAPQPAQGARPAAGERGGANEIQYQRQFAAGYDILEGRSWTDETGARTIVLRGNGAKLEGFEAAVERQRKEEINARIEEQMWIAQEQAAAQAEQARLAAEEQRRYQEELNQQMQMQNLQMLNQQLLYGGVYSRGIRITPMFP